jgi:hypothetical protein
VALLADGLTGGKGWADARMRFISRHDRATLNWSYVWRLSILERVWRQVSGGGACSSEHVAVIYDRMHSLATVFMLGESRDQAGT